ncbi:MAG: hypothetical protein ACUZ8O_08065 [Candidatus Anammoxibacter sp.]
MVGKLVLDLGMLIAGFADFYNTNGLSDTIKEDVLSGIRFYNTV